MEHIKKYHSQTMTIKDKEFRIEGPDHPDLISRCVMHEDLDAFRPPKDQHQALVEIAALPEGRVILARDKDTIVGYVTFRYPDEMERWSTGGMQDLIELGAIEVTNGALFRRPIMARML